MISRRTDSTPSAKKWFALSGAGALAAAVALVALAASSCACSDIRPVARPTVAGALQPGAVLTASPGAWRGRSPMTFAYRWQDCNRRLRCSSTARATGARYTLQGSDAGKTVRVLVTARNGTGSESQASPRSAVVPAAPAGVPCALTAAAEPCWASHTGVPGYSEAQILAGRSPLRHVVGNLTIATPGMVISNEWIDGCVAINADNVTIEDSLIHTQAVCQGGNQGTTGSAINDGNGPSPTGLVVKDTEVDGMNTAGDTYGISDDNYSCLRCNVHGFSKNLAAGNNVVIQDSYSHDLSINDQCSHANPVYADSATNVRVEHSYLRASGTSDGCITAAFMNGGSWKAPSNDTIADSYLEGVKGADMQEGCGSTGVRVINDAFSSDNGYSGTDYVYGFDVRDAGNVWTGDYVPELSHKPAPPPGGNPSTGGC